MPCLVLKKLDPKKYKFNVNSYIKYNNVCNFYNIT